jgi:hypothetical protein
LADRASGRTILLSSSYIEGVGEFRSARRRKLIVAAGAAVTAAGGRGNIQC